MQVMTQSAARNDTFAACAPMCRSSLGNARRDPALIITILSVAYKYNPGCSADVIDKPFVQRMILVRPNTNYNTAGVTFIFILWMMNNASDVG
eukprot:6194198-Pleurochrysis_carterae.AAC.2